MSTDGKERWSVIEETFGFVGAWYMALASIGLASTLVRLDDRVNDPEEAASV